MALSLALTSCIVNRSKSSEVTLNFDPSYLPGFFVSHYFGFSLFSTSISVMKLYFPLFIILAVEWDVQRWKLPVGRVEARLDEEGISPIWSVPSSIPLAVSSPVAGPTGSSTDFSLSCASRTEVIVLLWDTSSTPSQESGSQLCGHILGFVGMQSSLILFSQPSGGSCFW